VGRKLLGLTGVAALSLSIVGCASTTPINKDLDLVKGPAPKEIVSPYASALECLSQALSEDQKRTSFSVGSFPDRTGKINHVSDSGTGSFSTQGAEDMLLTSIAQTGVQVVDMGAPYRSFLDWNLDKAKGSLLSASVLLPDVSISGAITSLDFMPGGGGYINVEGAGFGTRQNRILVGIDSRAVQMLGGSVPAGKVVATDRIQKQVVGYEDEAGVSNFFGPVSSPTWIQFDLGRRENEAIQYTQRVMLDRVAYTLISKYFDTAACEEHLVYGDTLAQFQ